MDKTRILFEEFLKDYQLYRKWDDKKYTQIEKDLYMLDKLKLYMPKLKGYTLSVVIDDTNVYKLVQEWLERK